MGSLAGPFLLSEAMVFFVIVNCVNGYVSNGRQSDSAYRRLEVHGEVDSDGGKNFGFAYPPRSSRAGAADRVLSSFLSVSPSLSASAPGVAVLSASQSTGVLRRPSSPSPARIYCCIVSVAIPLT